jgi:hypothetical protein
LSYVSLIGDFGRSLIEPSRLCTWVVYRCSSSLVERSGRVSVGYAIALVFRTGFVPIKNCGDRKVVVCLTPSLVLRPSRPLLFFPNQGIEGRLLLRRRRGRRRRFPVASLPVLF